MTAYFQFTNHFCTDLFKPHRCALLNYKEAFDDIWVKPHYANNLHSAIVQENPAVC